MGEDLGCRLMSMNSEGVGFMALVALSGSIFYVILKAHQQLVSDFKKQLRRELGRKEHLRTKRAVTFADDVLKPFLNNLAYRKGRPKMGSRRLPTISEEGYDGGVPADMPLNRVAMYKGIREDRVRRGLLHLTRPCPYRDSAA